MLVRLVTERTKNLTCGLIYLRHDTNRVADHEAAVLDPDPLLPAVTAVVADLTTVSPQLMQKSERRRREDRARLASSISTDLATATKPATVLIHGIVTNTMLSFTSFPRGGTDCSATIQAVYTGYSDTSSPGRASVGLTCIFVATVVAGRLGPVIVLYPIPRHQITNVKLKYMGIFREKIFALLCSTSPELGLFHWMVARLGDVWERKSFLNWLLPVVLPFVALLTLAYLYPGLNHLLKHVYGKELQSLWFIIRRLIQSTVSLDAFLALLVIAIPTTESMRLVYLFTTVSFLFAGVIPALFCITFLHAEQFGHTSRLSDMFGTTAAIQERGRILFTSVIQGALYRSPILDPSGPLLLGMERPKTTAADGDERRINDAI
ncbi:uncharacterized protein BT62DRAFT_921193 [Guyanagaster necrorhizus]|uniref:Uncharacterized protein n=1 Tax=Guyanagaster necrorhizus TaxID=856835 RepID=A0A9P7VQZ9_9AGAR|nr:uncharacterized protein BT62DRAFT_921193 [Guyanagaster necrorhizus MCA 3950]KAG7444374.1 hypothetical protein BT62DRAFT_921193 [Guyanagaster necrorhizus MCA 3950]